MFSARSLRLSLFDLCVIVRIMKILRFISESFPFVMFIVLCCAVLCCALRVFVWPSNRQLLITDY